MEYQRYPPAAGIMMSLLVLVVMGAITVSGLWAVGNTVADTVGHVVSVVNTGTVEHNRTERTQIEWRARVEIEKVKADATKKTDFTFVVFYLLRALVWALGAAALAIVGDMLYQKWSGNNEPTGTTAVDG